MTNVLSADQWATLGITLGLIAVVLVLVLGFTNTFRDVDAHAEREAERARGTKSAGVSSKSYRVHTDHEGEAL